MKVSICPYVNIIKEETKCNVFNQVLQATWKQGKSEIKLA